MFYLNGDNNLTHEVLYTLDMLETVGSSDEINILALIDGRPGSEQTYGVSWEASKLVYVTQDNQIGKINSIILQDLGEQNLGSPETLESFIKTCMRYTADHYIFCIFTHGRGIIDTNTLATPGQHKSLAISIDETDAAHINLMDFRSAVQRGLDGKKFDAMVFFSCLTNMVEVGYGLKDLTRYLIGSEDEIRIVNKPPGRFQIRGIKFEEPLKAIQSNPSLSILDFGKITIDSFIEQYAQGVHLKDSSGINHLCHYSATMSIVDCRGFDQLAVYLDTLAGYINDRLEADDVLTLLKEIQITLSKTQRFASFLNLEYYDLLDFLSYLAAKTQDLRLKKLCRETTYFIERDIIIYERHTSDYSAKGISIYLSNFLVPENIFQSHQTMYRKSSFSRDTSWDEMIESLRHQMRHHHNYFSTSN
jgi:hypothetical protein